MIKILIGGSPCTHWSIAKTKDRETEPQGLGWELFKNYRIARDKFNPDFFLYENNKSAAQPIKDKIAEELGVELMHINSALVSAQNRQRFYAFNWFVQQPLDRGIKISDILEYYAQPIGTTKDSKSFTLTANYSYGSGKNIGNYAAHTIKKSCKTMAAIQTNSSGKSRTLQASYYKYGASDSVKKANPRTGVALLNDTAEIKYRVENGLITIKGEQLPVNLADGFYAIRKLTVTECCRLQTMPDDYCKSVSKTQAYKGLGNGWTAEVIIHILNGALGNIDRNEKIVVLSMYDGIGTGRYCLDKMGFTNVEYHAYEIDEGAMKIANDNYPDIIQHGDAFAIRNDNWKL